MSCFSDCPILGWHWQIEETGSTARGAKLAPGGSLVSDNVLAV